VAVESAMSTTGGLMTEIKRLSSLRGVGDAALAFDLPANIPMVDRRLTAAARGRGETTR